MDPFPITRIAHIDAKHSTARWLIEGLWSEQAVGFIAGSPKAGKTWLALELAVAVASGRPCLGHFRIHARGPVLLYAAEDTPAAIRQRVFAIAKARGITDLERLPLGLITEPELRLDSITHQERLDATLRQTKPRLVIFDPLVRLHHGDENSAGDISLLLGALRHLQREHGVAILLVHHIRKTGAAQPGQSLRGSGDLHAWSDSNLYLLHRNGRLQLHAEHRCHPSPEPTLVELHSEPSAHLRIIEDTGSSDEGDDGSLTRQIFEILADRPMSRAELRQCLRIRNERLGDALQHLERQGRLRRADGLLVPVPTP